MMSKAEISVCLMVNKEQLIHGGLFIKIGYVTPLNLENSDMKSYVFLKTDTKNIITG